jgi:hypothetical protein
MKTHINDSGVVLQRGDVDRRPLLFISDVSVCTVDQQMHHRFLVVLLGSYMECRVSFAIDRIDLCADTNWSFA